MVYQDHNYISVWKNKKTYNSDFLPFIFVNFILLHCLDYWLCMHIRKSVFTNRDLGTGIC